MARIAVIGEGVRVSGFALAGAIVCPAEGREQARQAWRSLPPGVALVVLTPQAAAWLGDVTGDGPAGRGPAGPLSGPGGRDGPVPRAAPAGRPAPRPDVLTVVMPP